MAHSYRGGDRTQRFLLPPDVRDWLPEDHLAWLVIGLVEAIDTSAFHALSRRGGVGRAGFDPDVLLALLLYAYAVGQRSSRQIERLCETDVACRVIMGNEVPDHTVIARFRQRHQDAFAQVFTQVLGVCARQGMGRVGTIALDGTKIAADASRLANRTREQLRDEVDRILVEAEAIDAREDAEFGTSRGDELPDAMREGPDRLARLRACLDDLDESYPEGEAVGRLAAAEQRVADLREQIGQMQTERAAYEAECAAGRRGRGRRRAAGQDKPPRPAWIARKQQALVNAENRLEQLKDRPVVSTGHGHAPVRNPTDPDSRLMRCQGGWIQGYNAQAAVAADGLIVAVDVTNNPADCPVFAGMLQRIDRTLTAAGIDDPVRAVLADTGYDSDDNLTIDGPPRLIPPRADRTSGPATGMRRRLQQPAMAALYQRRFRVEAAFARTKHNQGMRAFTRRGIDAARAEWNLISTVHNLKALHRQRQTQPRSDAG